jgi:asparagine N-glycosylation enzyme membrane subunit Stt3
MTAANDSVRRQRTLRARNRTVFALVAAVAMLFYALTWLRFWG